MNRRRVDCKPGVKQSIRRVILEFFVGSVLKKPWQIFNNAASSLTLTLSRWEREQPLLMPIKSASHRAEFSRCFAEKLGAFLPLPAGEGKGEGERQS
jgi:hypothetical protein